MISFSIALTSIHDHVVSSSWTSSFIYNHFCSVTILFARPFVIRCTDADWNWHIFPITNLYISSLFGVEFRPKWIFNRKHLLHVDNRRQKELHFKLQAVQFLWIFHLFKLFASNGKVQKSRKYLFLYNPAASEQNEKRQYTKIRDTLPFGCFSYFKYEHRAMHLFNCDCLPLQLFLFKTTRTFFLLPCLANGSTFFHIFSIFLFLVFFKR